MVSVFSLIAFVLAGCAGVPERAEPPEWLSTTPPASEEGVIIVGYGTGASRGVAKSAGEEDIEIQLYQVLLNRYDAEARGISIKTAGIIQDTAEKRRAVLSFDDTYTQHVPDGDVEVYLRVTYREEMIREDLETIRRTLGLPYDGEPPEDLEESALETTSVPEDVPSRKGPLEGIYTLLSEQASTEESAAEILDDALRRAAQFTFSAEPEQTEAQLGAAHLERITVRLQKRSGERFPTAPRFRAVVTAPEIDGQRSRSTDVLDAGSDGIALYDPPVPEVRGITRIEFSPVWLGETLDRWRERFDRPDLTVMIDALETRFTAETALRVTSEAERIPTAVIMIDRDVAGNPISGRDAARGAVQQFKDEGFDVVSVDLSASVETALAELPEPTVEDLYDLLPFDVLAAVERVVVGTAEISEFRESNGVTVEINVFARAFDLRRDLQLAEVSFAERLAGRDVRATLRTAFQAAGRRAARRIAPRLP